MSETNTPVSTSTSVIATGDDSLTLADEIKKYKTTELIDFLRKKEDLEFSEKVFEILEREEINGRDFLKVTKEELRSYGMPGGPASRLADFAKECKEKKLRSFSSYKTKKDLSEVLRKYGVDDGRITDIPQFVPKTHPIDDGDEVLKHCIKEIRLRLGNMGTVVESNEAIRCEYISSILHACVHIVKILTGKEITVNPQLEVVGEENAGRVDYAIKALEELICITEGKQHQIAMGFAQNVMQCESAYQTNKRKRKADTAFGEDYDYLYGIITTATEWYFLLYTTEGISCTSETEYHVSLTKANAKEENEAELRKNVKRVMEVIVGLLKDRVDVEKEPALKRQRVKGYFEKRE